MKDVMWGRWELDFVHISRFVSQSCTKEKDGCAEVCLDVQAIVLISLEVSTEVSEIRPSPASENVEETGCCWGQSCLSMRLALWREGCGVYRCAELRRL